MLSSVVPKTSSPLTRHCLPDSPHLESRLLESELTLKVTILHIIPSKDPRFYQATANVTTALNGMFDSSSTQGLILVEPFSNETQTASSCVGTVHQNGKYILHVNSTASKGHYVSLFPPTEWDEEQEELIKTICHDCGTNWKLNHTDDGAASRLPPLVACSEKMSGYCLNGGSCYHLATDEEEILCRCTKDYIGTRCEVYSFVDFARSHDKKIQDEVRSIALQFFLYGVALVIIAVIILLVILFCFYRCVYRQKKRQNHSHPDTKSSRMPSKYIQMGHPDVTMSPSNTLRNNHYVDDTASLISKSSYPPRQFQSTNLNEPKQLNGDLFWPQPPNKPSVELVKGPNSRRGSHGSVPSNLMQTTPHHNMENGYGQQLPGAATPSGRKPYATLPTRDY